MLTFRLNMTFFCPGVTLLSSTSIYLLRRYTGQCDNFLVEEDGSADCWSRLQDFLRAKPLIATPNCPRDGPVLHVCSD